MGRGVLGAELCPAGTFFTAPSVAPDASGRNAHFTRFSFRGSSFSLYFIIIIVFYIIFLETVTNCR